jgi:GDP-4-dehydro-6-deoxy-D-mannose reductase
MRALITGATGFVGGHLIEHLRASGDTVVGLSETGVWPDTAFVPPSVRATPLERLDLLGATPAAFAALIETHQPEAIYHLAAQANPQLSVTNPRGTWELNVLGTLALLEAVRASGTAPAVVLVGSGVSYGNPAPGDLPVSETCPVRPNNPYAASKAAADLLGIQHYLSHGTKTLMARPFNHAGPRQADIYALASFARQVAEVELGRRDRIRHGNLAVVRDYTDVRDIVRAYRLLATRGQPGEIYNIGSGRDISLAAMMAKLRGLARTEVAAETDPALVRPVDQPRLLADATKLRDATGWSPSCSIDETLAAMLDDWRERLKQG